MPERRYKNQICWTYKDPNEMTALNMRKVVKTWVFSPNMS